MRSLKTFLVLWVLVALFGCQPHSLVSAPPPTVPTSTALHGQVVGPSVYRTSATTAQVVASASVTLADRFGNAIATGITNGNGEFTLAPSGFVPATNGIYLLEAAKGLTAGAPGSAVARFRTILEWSGSAWLSISNGTGGTPIVLDPLTTAVALESALDPLSIPAEQTIGKVDATAVPATIVATPTYTGHPDTELTDLATLLVDYLTGDQDPTATVTGVAPVISYLGNGGGSVGDVLSITGTGFIPLSGRNTVRIGATTAPVYLATKTRLIVGVPAGATTGTVTVTTTFGTSNGIAFTVGTTTVRIDPNGYAGAWAIPGVTADWQREPRLVDLSPGRTYMLQVNGQGNYSFSVNASGAVTVSSGPFTTGTRLLTFDTVPIAISAGGSLQSWNLTDITPWQSGNQSVRLLRNCSYTLNVNGAATSVPFSVDGTNAVAVTGSSASGGAGVLTLQCTDVTVNPNGFYGAWLVTGSGLDWMRGTKAVRLVKAQTYQLGLNLGDTLPFQVDAAGAVATTDARASTTGATLTLATSAVTVKPNGFIGNYHLSGGTGTTALTSWASGNQTYPLVRSSTYTVNFQFGGTPVTFQVDGSGTVVVTSDTATGGAGQLNFSVQTVTINRNGYDAAWSIVSLTNFATNPSGQVVLLKGQRYALYPNGTNQNTISFLVDAAGTVSTSSSMATGGAGTLSYNIINVTVNPNGWLGSGGYPYWYVEGLLGCVGTQAVPLLKGGNHAIILNGNSALRLSFTVDTAGNVSSATTHTGGASALTFNTITTTVNVGASVRWYVNNVCGWHYGTNSVVLVKGLTYTLTPESGSNQDFSIASGGTASPASFTLGGNAYTLSP